MQRSILCSSCSHPKRNPQWFICGIKVCLMDLLRAIKTVDGFSPEQSAPNLVLLIFHLCTHYHCRRPSIFMLVALCFFFLLSTFPNIIDFSREQGVSIRYLKYEDLSLVICTLTENNRLILFGVFFYYPYETFYGLLHSQLILLL